MHNFDGLTMFVSNTAATGVVDASTRLRFSQRGDRVFARYAGGCVTHGWLVGRIAGEQLAFRYAQQEDGDGIHAGTSVCDIIRCDDGRLRLIEHFTWSTRPGAGVNVFDEVLSERGPATS
jgi:hypothetical protein